MQSITSEFDELVQKNGWRERVEEALQRIQDLNVVELSFLTDYEAYLKWLDQLVTWAPESPGDSRLVYHKIVEFYFVLDQPSLKELQSPVQPSAPDASTLTPLSAWIVKFANAMGAFLDTEESVSRIDAFKTAPAFNWDEYMAPPSGYKTFNQFFARHVKPGLRPVAALDDPSVIVAPADSAFVGWWQVSDSNEIFVESKGLHWSIEQLLEGSEYKDAFKGGIFTHSFLNTFDYHRWHAPVPGRVLESRVIQGQAYLDVEAIPGPVVDGKETRVLNALDGTGYQFVQTRGLAVLDSPIGLVACLPMGMAQVSSVVMTAEEGTYLRKGEELGYFQFGGSDFVMVFSREANVHLDWQPNVHVRQGMAVGKAYPAFG